MKSTPILLLTFAMSSTCHAEQYSAEFQAEQTFLLSQNVNDNGLVEKFDNLEFQLEISNDPIEEGRSFLNSYIHQINVNYGLSLTIEDACDIAKNNLDRMNLPQESYEQAVMILDLLRSEGSSVSTNVDFRSEMTSYRIYSPWQWNWFGLNKHHRKKSNPNHPLIATQSVSANITEIPGIFPFVVGLVEGAIGVAVFPFNPVAGGILIGDGCSRVIQGIQENLKENCENKFMQGNNRRDFPEN